MLSLLQECCPNVGKMLAEHRYDFNRSNPVFIYSCRRAYLLDEIARHVRLAWYHIAMYERSLEAKEDPTNQVYIKECIDHKIRKIRKHLTELHYRTKSLEGQIYSIQNGQITREDIERARNYDFNLLHDFRNNVCRCPFHADTRPSMVLKNNRVKCYSCDKSWDTIQFVMDKEGLTFPQAVKRLT